MLDPIDATIIGQGLLAAAREMGEKLVRSAFSTIVREARDASTAILDVSGRIIAQAEMIPIQLGSMGATLQPCLDLYPLDGIGEDDFFVNNHPYHGGQHLQDVFLFTPVFAGGRLIGFCGSTAHHLDLGGGRPGLNTAATDYYQEGLAIPPMKLSYSRDWNGGLFTRLLSENVRVPDVTVGDFNAQFAANALGARRMRELAARYGTEALLASMDHLVSYSEARMRSAIRGLPNGVYHGEDYLDEHETGERLAVRVTVTVEDDEVGIDFAETSPQVPRNINSPMASTFSAVASCLKGVLLPSDVPFNHGTALPITIQAPLGTLVNPRPPAPVRARMETSYRTYCAIMKALAQAAPQLVIASGADSTLATCFIGRDANRFRLLLEVHGGGFGASPREDGADGIAASLSNVTNTPVEAIDMEFDHIRVVEYGLIDDSSGSGRFRGGLGLRRVYQVTTDNVEFSCYGDRFRQRPEGLLGGTPGRNARCTIERDGVAIVPDLSISTPLRRGDRVVIETAGGAGYGDPSSREPSRLEADAVAGFVRSAGHPSEAPGITSRIHSGYKT